MFFKPLAKKIEGMNPTYHVCGICGSTLDEEPFLACPICNHPVSHYRKIAVPALSSAVRHATRVAIRFVEKYLVP